MDRTDWIGGLDCWTGLDWIDGLDWTGLMD